ncbi:MAG: hypothetical protein AB8B91_02630 [Rubripirellula sp.]
MKQFLALCFVAAFTICLTGCEEAGPSNSMQNADADAVAEYEALIAADAQAATEEKPDELEDQ